MENKKHFCEKCWNQVSMCSCFDVNSYKKFVRDQANMFRETALRQYHQDLQDNDSGLVDGTLRSVGNPKGAYFAKLVEIASWEHDSLQIEE